MSSDRILGAVAMCRGAGKLAIGFDAACKAAEKGAPLMLIASDASERTAAAITAVCENETCVLHLKRTQEQIEQATGRKFAVAAVCDENFARLIIQQSKEGEI